MKIKDRLDRVRTSDRKFVSKILDRSVKDFDFPKSEAKKIKAPTLKEQIKRLDEVRKAVLAKPDRLRMQIWHGEDWYSHYKPKKAKFECNAPHCIAGFLQAFSPNEAIREMYPGDAGKILAPIAAHMFVVDDYEAMEWLKNRDYAKIK